jgi:bifunctional non-homologous end joining protein LigD
MALVGSYRELKANESLQEYSRKRDLTKSKEPKAEIGKEDNIYSVQVHDALKVGRHRDIRIGLNGVLKSFVAKKELPVKDGDWIYVINSEDHPLTYWNWEGTIPEGSYGAGKVEVETHGTREIITDTPQELKVRFIGGKYAGVYAFIKLGGKVWKMIKMQEKETNINTYASIKLEEEIDEDSDSIWITPDGEEINAKDRGHEGWIRDNKIVLSQKYGIDINKGSMAIMDDMVDKGWIRFVLGKQEIAIDVKNPENKKDILKKLIEQYGRGKHIVIDKGEGDWIKFDYNYYLFQGLDKILKQHNIKTYSKLKAHIKWQLLYDTYWITPEGEEIKCKGHYPWIADNLDLLKKYGIDISKVETVEQQIEIAWAMIDAGFIKLGVSGNSIGIRVKDALVQKDKIEKLINKYGKSGTISVEDATHSRYFTYNDYLFNGLEKILQGKRMRTAQIAVTPEVQKLLDSGGLRKEMQELLVDLITGNKTIGDVELGDLEFVGNTLGKHGVSTMPEYNTFKNFAWGKLQEMGYPVSQVQHMILKQVYNLLKDFKELPEPRWSQNVTAST